MHSRIRVATLLSVFVLLLCGAVFVGAGAKGGATNWSMNATIIEACSCPMFCQCYFDSKPAAHAAAAGHEGHGAEHYCKFNNAYRVNKGSYKGVKLDGAKFWATGDLGAEFGDGDAEWLILTFDPSVTEAQREGIKTILGHVYPVTWKSFEVAADAPIEWKYTKDVATARLDGGKAAEVVLKRWPGNTAQPVAIHNLRYFGAPRNNGFILMPNEVEAYRLGSKAFEYKGTNGFAITFDINSKDVVASN